MILEEVNNFLDDKLELLQFEEWIYKTIELEKVIGQENYYFLLSFDYSPNDAHYKLKSYLLTDVTNEIEFAHWKVSRLLAEIDLNTSIKDLFSYCLENPNFLKGRKMKFKQLWSEKEIVINWTNEIKRFSWHNLENNVEVEFLDLGEYEDRYIYLVLNKKNEIWKAFDIVDKQEYFAKSLKEAFVKLILNRN
ncbi:hypothetical protein DF185_03405 [Marinifilum breve]|uniref:BRCT domain-containing protein n=1 Tax=Marinifilum breve TaxID=2184082 RepID=A0A2V4A2K2_9BACT|nr:hypothetical protein [Marinifilum breve]PXY03145.1 hypothetical protein DF185_03405 [Marinifilum breve]